MIEKLINHIDDRDPKRAKEALDNSDESWSEKKRIQKKLRFKHRIIASYRAELKKKIEEMIVWHDDAVLVSKQLLFDLIDQTTEI